MSTEDEIYARVAALRPHAMKLARRVSGVDIDDLLSETMLRALVSLHTFSGENFGAWLYAILRNVVYTRFSRGEKYPTMELLEEQVLDGGQYYATELRQTLQNMSIIPRWQADAMVHKALGYSQHEIAEKFKLKPGTIDAGVRRGRKELRRLMNGDHD